MEILEFSLRCCDLFIFPRLSLFGCFKDSSILFRYFNLVPSICGSILRFLITILFIVLLIFSLLMNLISLLLDVAIRRFCPNDFILDLHGSLLLLFGDASHVEFGRVKVVRVRSFLASKLIEWLTGATLKRHVILEGTQRICIRDKRGLDQLTISIILLGFGWSGYRYSNVRSRNDCLVLLLHHVHRGLLLWLLLICCGFFWLLRVFI